MKVKIVSCERPSYWYANKIGEVFDVTGEISEGDYKLIKDSAWISATDCEVVEEPSKSRVSFAW